MHVLAALGDAPTAAIAVVAIVVGLLLAVRGPREKRAAAAATANGGEKPGPAMVTLPVATAPEAEPVDAEPGFVGPAGEVVGHGPIRLGVHGPLGGEATAPPPPPSAPAAATVAGAPEPPAQESGESAAQKDPAWRAAARAATSAVHFRQGTIKIGGKAAGKPKDQ